MMVSLCLQILAAVEGAAQAVHNLRPPGSNAASPSGAPAGSKSSGGESPASSDEAHPGAAASPYAREGPVYPQSGKNITVVRLSKHLLCPSTSYAIPGIGVLQHCTAMCVPAA